MKLLIDNFIKEVEKKEGLVEAICISTSNKTIFKKQYIPRNFRNIYSHSKSFTSLMVGIAIDEKMIDLDTRLVEVFKDEIDDKTYDRLYEIKVRHLLTMSSGFNKAYLMSINRRKGEGYPDYFKFMLSCNLEVKPGSKFVYSNGDTYLLGRIIAKVYNKNFTQLCYEKIFKPLEMDLPIWGCDPNGYCICASELFLNIQEMNKLGVLFLNNGKYKGKQIVSKQYIDYCATTQIKTDDTRWGDYSFQFWMIPQGNGYRADGMWGQLTLIWPSYDIALSIQRPEDDRLPELLDILNTTILCKL